MSDLVSPVAMGRSRTRKRSRSQLLGYLPLVPIFAICFVKPLQCPRDSWQRASKWDSNLIHCDEMVVINRYDFHGLGQASKWDSNLIHCDEMVA